MYARHNKSVISACIGLGILLSSSYAAAVTYTLSDQNATFQVNTDINDVDGAGVLSMNVDGVDHIWRQDFLHDVTAAPVYSNKDKAWSVQPVIRQEIGMVDPGVNGGLMLESPSVTSTANTLTLDYVETDVDISLHFELVGGALGSNAATIIESYTITNTNVNGDISVNLFAFTDIDLGGSFILNNPAQTGPTDDRGELLGSAPYTGYRQYDNQYEMIATVNQAPDYYMVGIGEDEFGNQLNEVSTQLYDETDTLLSNTVETGPADLQMAAEWVRTLAPGESFTYIHTLALAPVGTSSVPVPAALWLLASGLIGLTGVARRPKKLR